LNRASIGNPPKIGLNWRVLGILNLYRILVPLVLLGLNSLGGSRGLPVNSRGYSPGPPFSTCFSGFSASCWSAGAC
jgi:hypothetical protein